MKKAALLVLLALASSTRAADETVPWPKKNDSPRVSLDDKGNLMVQGGDKPTTTTILTLPDPKVPSHQYRLVGKIKYADVAGEGYLEMWNYFPKQGPFFSKTLAPEGSMGKIAGSSDWRDLELPFYSKPDMLPTKLVINVVLPGSGKVWLTPLTIQAAEPMTMAEMEESEASFPWPLVGGLTSGLVGILGTLVALLSGNPAMRRPALALTTILVPTSAAALLLGVLPWSQQVGQSPWRTLILVGALWAALFAVTAYLLRHKLCQDELRQMRALDTSVR